MTIGPLIERELCALARQRSEYYLRVTVAAITLLQVVLVFPRFNSQTGSSLLLFQSLHCAVFVFLWLVLPFLAADCISRERREGTLGLLFLTPLQPWEVVAAKGLAHALRGMTFYLAALPALAIPMMFGGVSIAQVLTSALILGLSLALSLSAGLLASSYLVQRHHVMIAAALLSGLFLALAAWLLGGFMELIMASPAPGLVGQFLLLATNVHSLHIAAFTAPDGGNVALLVLFTSLAGMLVPFLIVCLAIHRIRILGKDLPPPLWRQNFARRFCTPVVAQGILRWRSRALLSSNPIAWLIGRRWTSRAMVWIWLGGVGITLFALLASDSLSRYGHEILFKSLFFLLAVCLAVDASGCFFRERSGGLLELILVSPVKEGWIVTGMTRALLWRYLPAAGFLFLLWWVTQPALKWYEHASPPELWLGYYLLVLPWLPMVGLYYSLRCQSFPKAVASTLVLGMLVPWLVTRVFWGEFILQHPHLKQVFARGQFDPTPLHELLTQNAWPPLLVQAAIAAFLCWALAWRLRDRNFVAF